MSSFRSLSVMCGRINPRASISWNRFSALVCATRSSSARVCSSPASTGFRSPLSCGATPSLSVEKTDVDCVSENVPFHCLLDLIACGALGQIQLLVQRRQLKRVVMGIGGAGARTLIGGLPGDVRALQRAAR